MWVGGARAIILDEKKRVLMVRQRHEGRDIWMAPGGAIEDGEDAEQAVIREVREETGLDISVISLLWHVEEVSEKRGQRFVNFFLAEVTGGELKLGFDPERVETGQALREVKFISEHETRDTEAVYPEYLKDELWNIIANKLNKYNAFKTRTSILV